jgi:hypothetical protein
VASVRYHARLWKLQLCVKWLIDLSHILLFLRVINFWHRKEHYCVFTCVNHNKNCFINDMCEIERPGSSY